MTKKIITPGTDTYRTTCHECGCQFTYERSDVWTNYVRGGDGVSCPSCGHFMHHFGTSGTVWPSPHRPTKYRRWECSTGGGYQPGGPLPKGSCFGA